MAQYVRYRKVTRGTHIVHYKVDSGHGLPHDPLKALVAPRPIGWISSMNRDGRLNLAPYSFFNLVSENPHMLMFSSARRKDSLTNAETTGEFVCSIASYPQRKALVACSVPLPPGESEFDYAGLETEASYYVKPPRVKGAPAALECRYVRTIDMVPLDGPASHFMVIGQIVGIFIDDSVLSDGLVDTSKLQPFGRGGYLDYFVSTEKFSVVRPTYP
jgi:flavin reductase (DIM6/NTAB) family NADH-FMN oxidoreductase RutF